jgi:hypothetical protein
VAVVMFGSDKDAKIAKHVQDFVKEYNGIYDGMHSAISPDEEHPTWPIRRSLATLQQCDLVIGPDTGLMWGVAMEPMPKLALLSHASPENITKHWLNTLTLHADPKRVDCWPCHQLHDTTETCRKAENAEAAACIADITSEEVLSAARAALKGEDNGRHLGVSTEGNAGLVAGRSGGDSPGSVVCWSVARGSVVNLGVRDRDHDEHAAPDPVDGGGSVASGIVQQHQRDDVRPGRLVGDD